MIAPIFATMSISCAPLAIASIVSIALINEVFAPSGNPITVHTFTPVPLSFSAAYFTWVGLKHTEANLYSIASLQN